MAKTQITRKDAVLFGGAAAGGLIVGGAAVTAVAVSVDHKKPPVEGAPIVAPYLDGDLPTTDPSADAWKRAERTYVALAPQQVAQPYLEEAGVASLDARALHNGNQVALLLEWNDDSVDDLDGIRRYHDAVAVQLPAKGGAAPALTMGAPGNPVHILQWRATWQRDIDSGGNTGVDQIYPAVVHDVMPDDVLPAKTAQLYWVGREAGNPLSQNIRSSPVEEVVAEGFGSATHLPKQTAAGHGVNEGGRWRVVIAVPSKRAVGDPLAPGSSWPVAFAVWLGSRDNRGGRKHIANWQTLVLEAKA
jgi:Ethylbenzene dehydrogenase